MNSNDLASPSPSAPLAIAEAAVERVVRRHEATLATLRETIRFAPVERTVTATAESPAMLSERDGEIASLRAELARVRATAQTTSSTFLRDELDRVRQRLARAEITVRAQGREIERLAAELERRP